MFSEAYYKEIKAGFDGLMALLEKRGQQLAEIESCAGKADTDIGLEMPGLCGRLLQEKIREISDTFARCTEEEAQALAFLYSASPLSDILDYPASLYLTYAKHGVFLWHQGPFAGRVPEKLFANYVLHHRVNNEDITDTRGFFYDKVKELVPEDVSGWQMYEAAVDVNYWCAREATYRSTDIRTQNARTMYGTATGRCGEESTFAVTVLRSLGIPARQVYAPLWTHCDDNHAWVEAWCDGKWCFLGACEPEEALDRGWFTGPAFRAMILHSRWFGREEPEDPQVGPKGMAKVLNHMERYAHTTCLEIKAVDEAGNPVPGARLGFQVPNHGEMGTVAVVYTGSGPAQEDCGVARLTTGFGDLYVSASGQGLYGEAKISLKDTAEPASFTVVLRGEPEIWEGWRDLDFHAPAPGVLYDQELTPGQVARGRERLEQAVEYRQQKVQGFYQEREAARVLGSLRGTDREQVEELLRSARSNMGELVRFLEWDIPGLSLECGMQWKLELLKTLQEKDGWDIRAEVLMDCVLAALPYGDTVPRELFFPYVVCPRVAYEMLRPHRLALAGALDQMTREALYRDPGILPGLLEKWVISVPGGEYEDLVTSPLGCLKGGMGSEFSRKVLCVNLYRSLGIPARLKSMDQSVEYYHKGRFVTVGRETGDMAGLILCEDGSLKLADWEHYRLERFDGKGFAAMWLWGEWEQIREGTLELKLAPGIYRILTTNRKKNGDQLLRLAVFELKAGEVRRVVLSMRDIPLEDMLTRTAIADFALHPLGGGQEKKLSELTRGGNALFLWLEVTKEPTEHILYELYDGREAFRQLEVPLYVVLKTPADLENATLRRTMDALPGLTPLLDDFGEHYRTLAESLGKEPGKLPLAVILNKAGESIYSDAGYNVGLADMLRRVLEG